MNYNIIYQYTLYKDFLLVSNKRGAFGISNNVGKAFGLSFFTPSRRCCSNCPSSKWISWNMQKKNNK